MSGALLTTQTTMMCPHGGSVSIVSANTRAGAGGAPLALADDTFNIAGCPFQIPNTATPHPCVSVRWVVTNTHTQVNGTATLSSDSAGLCLAADQAPQGPVQIVQTQAQARAS